MGAGELYITVVTCQRMNYVKCINIRSEGIHYIWVFTYKVLINRVLMFSRCL